MVIRMDASPSGVTIWLSGELDHHAARSLREQIDGAVDRDRRQTAPAGLRRGDLHGQLGHRARHGTVPAHASSPADG